MPPLPWGQGGSGMDDEGLLSSEREKQAALEDEAFDWVARLSGGEPSPGLRDAFAAWRAESPLHEAAAARAEALWADLGRTEAATLHRLERARSATAGSFRAGRGLSLSRRHFLAGGLAASAVLALGGRGAQEFLAPHADLETAKGERRRADLPDGSRLWLNTGSAVSLNFDGSARRVTLHRGEAFFEVAPGPAHPFTVVAEGCTARSASAVFALRCLHKDGMAARLTVASGKVEAEAPGGRSAIVGPDEALLAPEGKGPFRLAAADAGSELAWRRGKLIFNRRPFGAVVEEVSRFVPERILVLSDDLRRLEVTGVFDLERPEELLPAMELILPISITRLPFVTLVS